MSAHSSSGGSRSSNSQAGVSSLSVQCSIILTADRREGNILHTTKRSGARGQSSYASTRFAKPVVIY